MHPRSPHVHLAALLLAATSCGADRLAPAPSAASPAPAAGPASPASPLHLAARKLIRDGEVHLIVDEYAAARRAIDGLATAAGGFVGKTAVEHSAGRVSHASLTLRVPGPRFDEVVRGILQLGRVEREATGSRDVTDEYVDVAARLASAKKLEARLLALLESRPGKLSDVLEVERELARVREGIERLEGHVRVFDDQVELATLTVQLAVKQVYVAARAPTFGQDAREVLGGSAGVLGRALRQSALLAVALVPWSPFLAPPLLYFALRRRRARAA